MKQWLAKKCKNVISNMKLGKNGFLILSVSLWALAYIFIIFTSKYFNSFLPLCLIWRNRSELKTVLFWNTIFGDEYFLFGENDLFKNCANKCIATPYRYLMKIEDFDAILFHGINNEFDATDLPPSRKSHQKYIFVTLESPMNRNVPEGLQGFFNWTMTYMLNSDILRPYAFIETINNEIIVAPSEHAFWPSLVDAHTEQERAVLNKSRLAIWFRSNCNTHSSREHYVEELEKYMKVSKFGKCSNNNGCPKERECFKNLIEPHYFFYLSFENSLCDDYVTEKLFDALRHYVVPVVYGGANYSRFAPPGSYINALDFDTPKELAEHLVNLAKNLDEYKKYFNWKKFYRVVSVAHRTICELCRMLHTDNSTKSYSISDWYNAKRSCKLQENLEIQRRLEGPLYATRKTLNLSKPID